MARSKTKTMSLPSSVLGDTELSRVLRELKSLDEQVTQTITSKPRAVVSLPPVSHLLEELARVNALDLDNSSVRDELRDFLEYIKARAPIVHIAFAHEASADEIKPIVDWMRLKLHPTLLVHVGVQPEIVGGCTIRTANHFYDFSLRQRSEAAREVLLTKIGAL